MCFDMRVMIIFIKGICAFLVTVKSSCVTHCELFFMGNIIHVCALLVFSEGG